ncbi:hypothetical protein P152DRAFT_456746 [Eremomyces bilateralis CBS 781.70]|uniref:PiggyBac transposable element-derived protein domain-containing protein n=1 Tax=Eremomyces bilateralis CBS 781.70 TaxID=1392243 RepID=A0A6G1G926_9PEZI|nr:uncharacterized protein P152DRAFT_456746 [Eremomyces bilateralis CBS 781.70]KAF1814492.1 hypothetical protein P152DRAFT_456746 [Eremomyces bilateralis CBS 781.70]
MDNLFANIRLLSVLRRLGIGACGTTRANYSEYLRQHAIISKKGCTWPWNKQETLCVRDVASLLWKDRVLVRFLYTVFPSESSDAVHRRRPRVTGTREAREVAEIWGDEPEAMIQQPLAPIYYNSFMGGVDIAD